MSTWSMLRLPTDAETRAVGNMIATLLALAVALCAGTLNAQERGRAVTITTNDGFARLVVAYPVEAKEAPVSDGIVSIPVPRTIALPVDEVQRRLAGYVRAAERDREMLRLTLVSGVTVNVMAVGEKLFVDLLPESWVGLPPPLPQNVLDALARKSGTRLMTAAQRPSVAVAEPARPVVMTPSAPGISSGPVTAEVEHEKDSLAIRLPFAAPTNVALFRLGEALWLVLDTPTPIDISALARDSSRRLRDAELLELAEGRAIRIPLAQDEPAGIAARGTGLVLMIGENAVTPSRELQLDRQLARDGLASAFVPLAGAGRALRLRDPGSGEEIITVTAALPARGLAREQSFVDFRLLQSTHGLALVPRADDLSLEITPDGIAITRPGGLRLTGDGTVASIGETQIYGALAWQVDRAARFRQREAELIAALAAPDEQVSARLALARFYLANELGAEAKAVLDAAGEPTDAARGSAFFALRGLALLLLGRPGEAADELARPGLVDSGEAALIRAAALVGAARFAEAREAYRAGAGALSALPALLQRMVRMAALRAAIELDQVDEAGVLLHALESREPPGNIEPRLAVLAGRLAARLGRAGDAEQFLTIAERSADESAAAEARLRRIELGLAAHRLDRATAAEKLQALMRSWRGDATEAAARQLLEKLQAGEMPSSSIPLNRPVRETAVIP